MMRDGCCVMQRNCPVFPMHPMYLCGHHCPKIKILHLALRSKWARFFVLKLVGVLKKGWLSTQAELRRGG